MGADFSGVKIHTGNESDRLNHELESKAFTTGKEIFVRKDQYNPGSQAGQKLLAHELTHVVQQGGANNINGSETSQVQRAPGDVYEEPVALSQQRVRPTREEQERLLAQAVRGNAPKPDQAPPLPPYTNPEMMSYERPPAPPPRSAPQGAGIYEQPRVETSAGERRQAEREEFERQAAKAANKLQYLQQMHQQ